MTVTVVDAIERTSQSGPRRWEPASDGAGESVVDLARADPSVVANRLCRSRRVRLRGPGLSDVPVERPRQCEDDAEWLAAVAPTVLATAGEHRLAARLAGALLAATMTGTEPARVSAAGCRVLEALVAHVTGQSGREPVYEVDTDRSVEALGAMVEGVAVDDAEAFVAGVDRLLGGVVTLLGPSSVVLARSRPTEHVEPEAPAPRTMLIVDDGQMLGTLELPAAGWWSTGEETILRNLSRLVLHRRRLLDEVRDLRQRMALTSWFTPDASADVTGDSFPAPLARRSRLGRCRPFVVSFPPGLEERSLRAVGERLLRACREHPALATATLMQADGRLVGVYAVQGPGEPRAEAEVWKAILDAVPFAGLSVSVGRQARAGDELRTSYTTASAVAHLQRDGSNYLNVSAVAVGEELGASAELLFAVSAGQVPFVIERVLGELVTDDRFGGELVETLYAYLVTRGSPQEAGRLLHLHVSSVKYRMRVIRQLLGARLDEPAQRFELELAARLYLAAQEFRVGRRDQR